VRAIDKWRLPFERVIERLRAQVIACMGDIHIRKSKASGKDSACTPYVGKGIGAGERRGVRPIRWEVGQDENPAGLPFEGSWQFPPGDLVCFPQISLLYLAALTPEEHELSIVEEDLSWRICNR
jgi:hypothetical protein